MLIKIGTRLLMLIVILTTVGCDRVTKHIAVAELAGSPTYSFLGDTVRLTYAENTGGFLSLGANLPPGIRTAFFTVGTGVVMFAVALLALRLRWNAWQSVGIALFVAGGASNWIDRLLHGSVVDFLNVGVGWLRTGIFNVADVAIMAGFGIFLLSELQKKKLNRP